MTVWTCLNPLGRLRRLLDPPCLWFIAPLFAFAPGSLAAEEMTAERPDKSQYNLFNPTPRHLLRELATDRPDKTETAYSVDAGHFQLELDLITYTRDRYDPEHHGVLTETWTVGPINLKLGLLNNVDAQLMLEPYTWVQVEDRSGERLTTSRTSGFGDVSLRSKITLIGNDGGKLALGVLPYLKLPTNQGGLGNHSVEGGFVVAVEYELPKEFELASNAGLELAREDLGSGYHPKVINTVTLGHDLIGKLSGYIEFWSVSSTEGDADWLSSLDLGFNYLVTPDLKLDFGVNIGLTRAADDWNPFVGLSWRY
jgi:hypothetical protein